VKRIGTEGDGVAAAGRAELVHGRADRERRDDLLEDTVGGDGRLEFGSRRLHFEQRGRHGGRGARCRQHAQIVLARLELPGDAGDVEQVIEDDRWFARLHLRRFRGQRFPAQRQKPRL
jgi:hypothetical protein